MYGAVGISQVNDRHKQKMIKQVQKKYQLIKMLYSLGDVKHFHNLQNMAKFVKTLIIQLGT